MRVEGYFSKNGKYWAISIPEIALFTQGRSKKDAFLMMQNAIQELVEDLNLEFQVEDLGDGRFYLTINDTIKLVMLISKQRRMDE